MQLWIWQITSRLVRGSNAMIAWFLNQTYQFRQMLIYFWQRRTRGWDDRELWSLDVTLSKMIAPRLRRLKEIQLGHPGMMTEEEWDACLDKMIASFEFTASDDFFGVGVEGHKVHEEGLILFGKYFWSLWH